MLLYLCICKQEQATKSGAQLKAAIKQNKMEQEIILTSNQLQIVANAVACRMAINAKEVLTFDEACIYTGLSKSAMYKQTMGGSVPHYKPNGKLLYFNRNELTNWLLQNRCATNVEIDNWAQSYTGKPTTKKKGGKQ